MLPWIRVHHNVDCVLVDVIVPGLDVIFIQHAIELPNHIHSNMDLRTFAHAGTLLSFRLKVVLWMWWTFLVTPWTRLRITSRCVKLYLCTHPLVSMA